MGQFAINSTDDVKIKQFVKITPTNISYFDILHLAKRKKRKKNLKSEEKKNSVFMGFFLK